MRNHRNGNPVKYFSNLRMSIFWSLEDIRLSDVWLTIGSFDGVHKGHQAIVSRLTAGAHKMNVPAVVLSFHPHPAIVLRGRTGSYYLTSPQERADLLTQVGVDHVIIHPFNQQIADLSAFDFIQKLHHHLSMVRLCVGQDFALGKGRKGDLDALDRLGKTFGYALQVIQPVVNSGQVISSSRIRAALGEGDVEQAAELLGRKYTVIGNVIPGDGRGRQLGIPTANLDIWSERALPKTGVYACRVDVERKVYHAVTNIGFRPTFQQSSVTPHVETHILDYDGSLYDKQIVVSFINRLRNERKFTDIQALVDQIRMDIQHTRILLEDLQV